MGKARNSKKSQVLINEALGWGTSGLGLILKKQNPRLFDRLHSSLEDSYYFHYPKPPTPRLRAAIISLKEIELLQQTLQEVNLSLTTIDSSFIEEILNSWKLFYRWRLSEEHQQARCQRFKPDVQPYDSSVKKLKKAPQLSEESKARLDSIMEEIRAPWTGTLWKLGGYGGSGPISGDAWGDPSKFEFDVAQTLQQLRAQDPRYRRLHKTFRHWPIWKDVTWDLVKTWNPAFTVNIGTTLKRGRDAGYDHADEREACHRLTIAAVTKLLHLCFPLWFPDNITFTSNLYYKYND